jgi:mono/diheme cytochrome c family protein
VRRTRLSILGALAAVGMAACTGEFVTAEPGVDAGAAVDAGAVGSVAGRAFFAANVAPLLALDRPKGSCAFCHQQGLGGTGPFFLGAAPDEHYAALVSNPRLVGATPEESLLVTRGDHTGNAFCTGAGAPYAACGTDELAVLGEWIAIEAR